ncbi:MAG: glycosyl hydrolase 115 family protein [Melioribacter sp.]|uniref:glycosyl hydrolase 115 family protein n=1 Tax=Rosettibacter primus TaxID=3111523 RepID=UPI00247C5A7B|nr:glycosyl hydrolase 115 family protein [Melioribacter sp.]
MKPKIYLIIISFLIYNSYLFAQIDNYVSTKKDKDYFTLSAYGKSAPIIYSSKDYPGVIKVIKHLQNDIEKVTGAKPQLINDDIINDKEIIIVGTLGKSPLIDKLIEEKIINVDELKGKWEKFNIQVVEGSSLNVKKILVIVGSDKRGTIFGLYDLSEKIGVSPWYWWADVPVKKKKEIYIKPGIFTLGEPKIKYRGIFINDEAPALTGWAYEKFGGFNSKFYEKVFELILRLKGNFLWPAMWGKSFFVDDTLNPKLADEYGIVISTSHHEPMMRAHVEWSKFGKGPWNYEKNDSVLREFWREGIRRMGSYESIVTIGMRGDGDEPMSEESNIALLERIVRDQRKILEEVTGKKAEEIPQVWALYKEVQDYYEKGMKVPDDVTLLLCDDNWGNIRKLPALNEKPRKGGYGIYYHYDYVGGPRNYKWLNTNQIERVWEQMHLAYEYGARQIWVVNVGDIKPMEFPISFFLDYAWNPDLIPLEKLPEYSQNWAEKQFGKKYSKEIGEILNKYTKYNSRRKPELLSPDTYSLVNYREFENVVNDYNDLLEKAKRINNQIPSEYKDAYYQLVLHPVEACANLNELYYVVAKNRLYAKQGRALTNSLADYAEKLFEKDSLITVKYHSLGNGKWNHMMSQTHIGYTYWQQPDKNIMPEVKRINLLDIAEMGVAVEGSENWYPSNNDEANLPEFDVFNKQSYYLEIFNKGKVPFKYSIKAKDKYLKIDKAYGIINTEKRIWISVDWNKAPKGKNLSKIFVEGTGKKVIINLVVNNPAEPKVAKEHLFIESNNYISIEAENFSKAVNSNNVNWVVIPNLGRTSSAVTVFPVTSLSQKLSNDSPHLEYNVYLFSSGEIKVSLYFSPTMNFTHNPEGIRYAVSFDDESPQIFNMTSNPNPPDLNRDPVWNKWVADNINIQTSTHNIKYSGNHVLKIWMIDPGIVIQKIVIDAGGVKNSYLGPPESFNGKLVLKK